MSAFVFFSFQGSTEEKVAVLSVRQCRLHEETSFSAKVCPADDSTGIVVQVLYVQRLRLTAETDRDTARTPDAFSVQAARDCERGAGASYTFSAGTSHHPAPLAHLCSAICLVAFSADDDTALRHSRERRRTKPLEIRTDTIASSASSSEHIPRHDS